VRDYIKNNVNRNGTVYVLGGPAVIPDGWLGSLGNSYNVKRLAGSNRYGSNIEVLKEVGYSGGRILVCVGTNFADSLSASAVKLPILLVGTGLNDDQKAFLKKCSNAEFIIIGGEGAVSSAVEKELGKYGKVTDRLAGTNRFHTSMLIAYHLFEQPSSAVLAYGRNFPDGLSGGSLAYALQGPLLLVENNKSNCNDAAWITYIYETDRSIILGGTGLISDDIARYVLNLSSKQKIKVITNN
ncbi:MAG: cell wall-binding repeat-containing protein, partial [Erysipelotrichaceae bacterium]|nr:cell wall-binding repeat-containing protein [Erysipelotrichaceae bacterium]